MSSPQITVTASSSNEGAFREYGVEYVYGGSRWTLSVMATSPEDAMARIKQAAAWGHCFTPHGIVAKVPASLGPFVRLWTWSTNNLRWRA